MKNSIKFFALSLVLICFNQRQLFSQTYYKAGNMLGSYIDVDPDTVLGENTVPYWIYFLETFDFDINGDNINDFSCKWVQMGSAYTSYRNIDIIALNSNSQVRTDSLNIGGFHGEFVVDLEIDDTINEQDARWSSDGTIYTSVTQTSTSHSASSFTRLTPDHYSGIRYNGINDTIYGWVRINWLGYRITVHDYSVSSSIVQIGELNNRKFNLFPNPASTRFYIDILPGDIDVVQIFDGYGKLILSKRSENISRMEIDISGLAAGIYFVVIPSSEGLITRKLVVNF